MGPKKPTQRLPAKTAACTPSTDDASVVPLTFIPADPEDARLTFDGLELDSEGKVDICAYEDLMPCFSGEPSPEHHPDPEHPGVRRGEHIPKGLKVWDDLRTGGAAADRKGAGWIACHYGKKDGGDRKKEKWFNIRSCGSWRMAFLLARLQRIYWDERAVWLRKAIVLPSDGKDNEEPANAAENGTEVSSVSTVVPETPPLEATKLSEVDPSSGQGLPHTSIANIRNEASRADPITPKKRPALDATEERAQKSAKKKGRVESQKSEKATPLVEKKAVRIGADTLASSVRLQQILAARQLQQQQ